MRATKKRCLELIKLCAGLDYFPTDPAIRELLVETLRRNAIDDSHAERIITRWLETETRAPKIADIVELARQVSRTPVIEKCRPNWSCERCFGLGFAIVIRADSISGASRCPNGCPIPGADTTPSKPRDYTAEHRRADERRAAASKRNEVPRASGELIAGLYRDARRVGR